jgi:hypothetical protein
VTFRDETLILRERLGELEVERARQEGRRAGLEVALAEAEERLDHAERELARLPGRRRVKRMSARTLGVLGVLAAVAAALTLLALLGEWSSDIDHHLAVVVERSERAGLAEGTRCTVEIVETDEDPERPCEATLRCGGRAHYRGRGGCAEFFDADLLEYWDHALDDGSPGLVVVESEGRAVLRKPGGFAVLVTPSP